MTDDAAAVAVRHADQEPSASRCPEFARTERGYERCHRDVHKADVPHHVRDRSWSTAGNMPQLRLGEPCTAACTWPDQVMKYRGSVNRRA